MTIVPYNKVFDEELFRAFIKNTPVFFDKTELNEFQSYLNKYPNTYFVIQENNSVIGGFGYELRDDDKSARINWIFIDPDCKQKGYGKLAVRFCLDQFKKHNSFKTSIIRTSQHAYEFFISFGYQLKEIKKNYWAPGLDLYLMEMNLQS